MPSIYDDFLAIDLVAIDRFVSERRQEDLRLDFKELTRSPEFDKTDKKNLAKAMSGFSNSDGGLIVWGVEARKDADGVDAASAKKPIPNVEAAHSKILSLTGEATGPIVDGVEHRVLKEPGATDGYIITYVPGSDSGPHMARLGEGRYYKRSGDSFYSMEHFDLEDMFGRRPKPLLEVVARVARAPVLTFGNQPATTTFDVILGLRNLGRGIARFPFLRVEAIAPYFVTNDELDSTSRYGLPIQPSVKGIAVPSFVFGGGSDHVIHAGTEINIVRVRTHLSNGSSPSERVANCWFGADGVAMRSTTKNLDGGEIDSISRMWMVNIDINHED